MTTETIREAMARLSASIAAEPAKAKAKNVPATARLREGLQCELTGPYNERFLTDMPPAMGGAASGPNPGWLLRGALASCTATVIAMRAAKQGIALRTLEVTVETDSDLRGILGIDEEVSARHAVMRMKVRIGAPGVSPEILRELVEWAEAHSPVSCTVKEAPACSLEVELVKG
jgi:uncharacterized OsmC-like protein